MDFFRRWMDKLIGLQWTVKSITTDLMIILQLICGQRDNLSKAEVRSWEVREDRRAPAFSVEFISLETLLLYLSINALIKVQFI